MLDLKIFLVCAPLIVVWGLAIALARSVRSPVLFPLRLGATIYVDVVRGVPILLWLFLIGFGGAGLINKRHVGIGPIQVDTLLFLGGLALVIVYSAYVAEVFRAGIESVHESQRSAARSLALSTWQTNRHVVLPQAIRRVVPPLMNDFISLQKDVALVSRARPGRGACAAPTCCRTSCSTSRRSSWPPCCSCASRSRSHGPPTTCSPRSGGR